VFECEEAIGSLCVSV